MYMYMCIYLEGEREGRERLGMPKHSGRMLTTGENLGEGYTGVLYTFLHLLQKYKIISKWIFKNILQINSQICPIKKKEFLMNVASTKMPHLHLTNDYLKFSLLSWHENPFTKYAIKLSKFGKHLACQVIWGGLWF